MKKKESHTKRGNHMNRLIAFTCVLAICLTVATGMEHAFATQGDKKTENNEEVIRVGFPLAGGSTMLDEKGNLSGYTYEYLQEIAQHTGWKYEFVEMSGDINQSVNKALEMLENGEIDLVGNIIKNEQTMALYDFPEYGYGNSYKTLCVPVEDSDINETNYQSEKGLKIAVYKDADRTNGRLAEFCKLNNIDYVTYEYETSDELYGAAKKGIVDVVLGNDQLPQEGFRTIAQFDGTQFYFAVAKGRPDIVSKLNSTISTIKQIKPYFETSLYGKYFSVGMKKMSYSDKERDYIQKTPALKIAMLKELPPIEFKNGKGEIKGIAKEVLDEIQKDTGLRFEYVAVKNYAEAYQLLHEKKVDIVSGIPYEYELAQSRELIMTNSFLSSPMVFITRKDFQRSDENTDKTMYSEEEYFSSEVNKYETMKECINAVLAGEAEYMYINMYSAEYLNHYTKYSELRMIPQPNKLEEFCFGVSKNEDVRLVSIFNKALQNMSSNDMEMIIYRNSANVSQRMTLTDFIRQNPIGSMAVIALIFLILLVLVFSSMRMKVKTGKRLALENQRYMKLSEMANEFIYEYDCEKDNLSLSKKFAAFLFLPESISNVSVLINKEAEELKGLDLEKVHFFRSLVSEFKTERKLEVLYKLDSGEQRWYRHTWAEVIDPTGDTHYIIGKLTDIQNEKKEKELLEQQVMRDGLTGIYNATAVKDLIGEKLSSLAAPGTLIIIDIDHFKLVNDKLGHFVGDQVLREFAQMLMKSVGPWDIVGRFGGDEFMVYIDNCGSYNDVAAFCAALSQNASKTYTNEEGESHPITISIGGVLIREGCQFKQLYQLADKQLYRSKHKGRNCYTIVCYEDEEEQDCSK